MQKIISFRSLVIIFINITSLYSTKEFKLIKTNDLHPDKKLFKTFVSEILKLDRSNDINDLSFSNMPSIFCTFVVSKLDKSIDSKEVQFLNIFLIALTDDVLNILKSNDVKEELP